jgi:hypothetical protein
VRPGAGGPDDGPGPGARPTGRRVTPRAAVGTLDRSAPLVARAELPRVSRSRPATAPRTGRIARFVQRYGWRAYAIPLLTVATVVTLVDLALTAPAASSGSVAGSTPTTSSSAPAPPVEVEATPTTQAQGEGVPTGAPATVGVESYVEQGAGTLSLVDGTSAVSGSGPLRRFIVEIEDGIGVDGLLFAQAVEATLGDPRSWGNGGRASFQRVGAAEAAAGQFDFKVSLVSPGSMERYCPGVGTGGYTSCRYGDRAVINLARWATAVPDYEGDVATYRQYVVNHEVGHALGNREHPPCPGPGQLAPVMQQQTLGLDGCVKNPWPYP